MKQPFRFYGARPGDWFDGLVYEIRFVEAPSAAVRVAIAEAVETAAHGAPVTLHHGPWRWSGRHLRIDAYADDEQAAFEAMEGVLVSPSTIPSFSADQLAIGSSLSDMERWTARPPTEHGLPRPSGCGRSHRRGDAAAPVAA
jgi:hypothetical protein